MRGTAFECSKYLRSLKTQLYATLSDPHCLVLHQPERLGVAVLSTRAGDAVEGGVQPLPLALDLGFSGLHFRQTVHACPPP
jgi:hypothetical protein